MTAKEPRPTSTGFKPVPEHPLTQVELLYALAALLSSPELFARAKGLLRPASFAEPAELGFRLLWQAALAAHEAGGHDALFAPEPEAVFLRMSVAAGSVVERERVAAGQPALQELLAASLFSEDPARPGALRWIYRDGWPGVFRSPDMSALVARLLRQKVLNYTVRETMVQLGGMPLANIGQMAQSLRDTEVLISSTGRPRATYTDTDTRPAAAVPEPTGITWFDQATSGGLRAGNLYLLSGCTGAGKTTLAAGLGASVAAREAFFARGGPEAEKALEAVWGPGGAAGYQPRTVYYFHYEMLASEVRDKVQSCAAFVDFRQLERRHNPAFELAAEPNLPTGPKGEDWAALSSAQYRYLDVPPLPEKERYALGCALLGDHLVGADFTGSDPRYADAGRHGVDGLVGYLDQEAADGHRPALVIVDYVQAMAQAASGLGRGPEKDVYYMFLLNLGHQLVTRVAQKYACPVLILSQFNTEANKRSPALPRHHSEASHCGALANAAACALNLGNPDPAHNVRLLNDSKGRFNPLGAYRIMTIAGPTNRFVDMTTAYELHGGSFYRRSDVGTGPPAGDGPPAPVAAVPGDPFGG
jgi:hypothetical protein